LQARDRRWNHDDREDPYWHGLTDYSRRLEKLIDDGGLD
jgi:hypothetical protein